MDFPVMVFVDGEQWQFVDRASFDSGHREQSHRLRHDTLDVRNRRRTSISVLLCVTHKVGTIAAATSLGEERR